AEAGDDEEAPRPEARRVAPAGADLAAADEPDDPGHERDRPAGRQPRFDRRRHTPLLAAVQLPDGEQVRGRGVTLASNPVMVGALTVLIVVLAVFLAYNANSGLPFVPTYRISVDVPDADTLVP